MIHIVQDGYEVEQGGEIVFVSDSAEAVVDFVFPDVCLGARKAQIDFFVRCKEMNDREARRRGLW